MSPHLHKEEEEEEDEDAQLFQCLEKEAQQQQEGVNNSCRNQRIQQLHAEFLAAQHQQQQQQQQQQQKQQS